jgi:hypothetical protein
MAEPSKQEKNGGKRGGIGGPAPGEAVCGGVGRGIELTVASGNHTIRERVTGSGSPVMRPKALPSSEWDSGKAAQSLIHQ